MNKVKKAKAPDENQDKYINDLKVQLVRALADYDNLKKRVDAEKEVWFKVASARVIGKFLGVIDMLIDAQKHLNDPGLAIVLGEFKKAIEDEGFEEIAIEQGVTEFDSETMEATEVVNGDDKNENKVAEVVQSGWKAKENMGQEVFIVRPVKVKVYKKQVEN